MLINPVVAAPENRRIKSLYHPGFRSNVLDASCMHKMLQMVWSWNQCLFVGTRMMFNRVLDHLTIVFYCDSGRVTGDSSCDETLVF